jgi:hypothetical protein
VLGIFVSHYFVEAILEVGGEDLDRLEKECIERGRSLEEVLIERLIKFKESGHETDLADWWKE